jgi:hypothetical protein
MQGMSEPFAKSAARFAETGSPDDVPEYYIEAQTSLVERPLRTLKAGGSFAVLEAYGDVGTGTNSSTGRQSF